MSDGPYTEGWPRRVDPWAGYTDAPAGYGLDEVVPLSDAERMREALARAESRLTELTMPPWHDLTPLLAEVRDDLRVALNPEQGE